MSLLAPWNIPDQGTLWPEEEPGLAYAVRRHLATSLHWDFRIRVRNVLFSWCLFTPIEKSAAPQRAKWTDFHDPKLLLTERVIPSSRPGTGPTFVEDTGFVRVVQPMSASQNQAFLDAYQKGKIELEISGYVLHGNIQLRRRSEEDWSLQCLELHELPIWLGISCLTGRDFDDLKANAPSWLNEFPATNLR